ncbi:hypothetical protein L596_013275 [Steinernema carpocapsae]|uniref:SKP1 component POZ domain-containing protein n=1 Tax=Steinernema carpocapsae TaxID=34508 RepID=A0A4U5P066_STECR|nr:hypothetical protein L596_013275 [Steinernema carpocapsae]
MLNQSHVFQEFDAVHALLIYASISILPPPPTFPSLITSANRLFFTMSSPYNIVTSDGQVKELPAEVLTESRMLSDMIESTNFSDSDPIPLADVDAETIDFIFNFCKKKNTYDIKVREDPENYDPVFQDCPRLLSILDACKPTELYRILTAANFLEVSSLFECLCSYIAHKYVDGKSADEIRQVLLKPEEWEAQHLKN